MEQNVTLTVDPTILGQLALVAVPLFLVVLGICKVMQKGKGKIYFGIMSVLSVVSVLAYSGVKLHNYRTFDAKFNDYIKATYNAKDASEAKLQYDRAMDFVKEEGMKEGSTAFLYPSPQYNVADWYAKLDKASKSVDTLAKRLSPAPDNWRKTKESLCLMMVSIENPSLRKDADNVLDTMQGLENLVIRESNDKPWQKVLENLDIVKIKREGVAGDTKSPIVNSPEGISAFPNNMGYFLWLLMSFISFLTNGTAFICKTAASW